MSGIIGLSGFNPPNGNNKLIANFGSDLVDVINNSGYGQNLFSSNNGEFESYVGKLWFTNQSSLIENFDGTTWTKSGVTTDTPLAKFIKQFRTRLYLGNLIIAGTPYPSRVWFSDLPVANHVTWGYENQNNLQQAAGSGIVKSPGAKFVSNNIKEGDTFVIIDGPNAGEYIVSAVIDEQQLVLTKALTFSYPASNFWCGGNWFDVATDDSDFLTGFGKNSDFLLCFKNNSLHKYDEKSLVQIKDVPGTTSGRSIANTHQFTFYFHPTGIWRCNGATSELISRQVQDYIDGIAAAQYNQVVGWIVGADIYRCYVGAILNADTEPGIDITNGFLDQDVSTQTWTPGSYPFNITCATTFVESQAINTYLGTDAGKVYQDNTGNSDDTVDIPLNAETIWHWPFGPLVTGKITRVQVITRTGRAISVKFKRFGIPTSFDKEWKPLGEVRDAITEFLPDEVLAEPLRAIKLLITESSSNKPIAVEKIIIFGVPETIRVAEQDTT